MPPSSKQRLDRVVGLREAVLLGLGSIVGTGVFVSVGIAVDVAGSAVLIGIVLAGLVATCVGLATAQLAAQYPVSGSAYEYGYRLLTPWLGFTAGWMFLFAKTASAATAALGLAGYLVDAVGGSQTIWRLPVALGAVGLLTMVVLGGMKRSARVNAVIVTVTLGALGLLVMGSIPTLVAEGPRVGALFPTETTTAGRLAIVGHATALMFVAFTGFGRIATLGEEVVNPGDTIPRAVIVTLGITIVLYVAVAAAGIGVLGPQAFARATAETAAPLEAVARRSQLPGLAMLIAVGAATAMIGVLLNLILGLSRMMLAMGRRGDLPKLIARLDPNTANPAPAVALTAVAVAGLVLLRDIRVTWSLSAFSVLVYYAIVSFAALRLPATARRYPPAIPAFGLAACLLLAFWIDPSIWRVGLGILVVGLAWHFLTRRLAPSGPAD